MYQFTKSSDCRVFIVSPTTKSTRLVHLMGVATDGPGPRPLFITPLWADPTRIMLWTVFPGNSPPISQICRICWKIPWHYAGGCVPKKRTIYGHINLPSSLKDTILVEFWVLLLRKGGNFKKRMQECCFLFVKLHLVQYCFSPALGWFRCAHLYFKDFHIVPNDKQHPYPQDMLHRYYF